MLYRHIKNLGHFFAMDRAYLNDLIKSSRQYQREKRAGKFRLTRSDRARLKKRLRNSP